MVERDLLKGRFAPDETAVLVEAPIAFKIDYPILGMIECAQLGTSARRADPDLHDTG
jgi:hypothetical protein